MLRCVTPSASRASRVTVEVVRDAAAMPTGVTFAYHAPVSVISVVPSIGMLQGGTLVRVRGRGFGAASPPIVRIGGRTLVRSRVMSETLLECVTPPRASPALVALELSVNGQDFSADEVVFEYGAAVRLDDAAPPRGPISGGCMVVISGDGFSWRSAVLSYAFARFNLTVVPVVMLSARELRCVAPEHASGVVVVSVTMDGQQYTVGGGSSVRFEYEASGGSYVVDPATGPVRGGTLVVVRGAGLRGASWRGAADAFCRFGASGAVGASVDGEGVLRCVTPPAARSGIIALQLIVSEAFVFSLDFRFSPHAHVVAARPLYAAAGSSVVVNVRGAHLSQITFCCFRPLHIAACKFVSAAFSTPVSVSCASPAFLPHGTYAIALSSAGGNWSSPSLLFEVLPQASILLLSPNVGPHLGGTPVHLLGSGFSSRPARLGLAFCSFNVTSVPAVFVSPSEMLCTTISETCSVVNVKLSNDGQTYIAAGAYFTFTAVTIHSISPVQGPLHGGTIVTIACRSTHLFSAPANASCEFNDTVELTATARSSCAIVCATPMVQYNGEMNHQVFVRVKYNGGYMDSALLFTYIDIPRLVLSQTPLWGPTAGGTAISVLIQHSLAWYTDAFCHFKASRVPLVHVSSPLSMAGPTKYRCIAPLYPEPTILNVTVSFSSTYLPSAINFEYVLPARIYSLDPTNGQTEGGTRVSLYGSGFSYRSSALSLLSCLFNHTRATALRITDDHVCCISPPMAPGATTIEVTTNEHEYTNDGHVYTFLAKVILNATPRSGPTIGNTVVVLSLDSSAFGAISLKCAFDQTLGAASLHSSSSIVCLSPTAPVPGTVQVSVVLAGMALHSSTSFRYYEETNMTMLSPILGPEHGGTRVVIYLRSSLGMASAWCRFVSHAEPLTTLARTTPALVISSHAIACVAPSVNVLGNVAVHVSQNQVDFSLWGLNFEYVPQVRLTHIVPSRGPIEGGTLLHVHGERMAGLYRASQLGLSKCKLHQTLAVGGITVQATRFSPGVITCVTAKSGHMLGAARIELTVNGADYSSDGQVFHFLRVTANTVTPNHGPYLGGTPVEVHGTNLGVMLSSYTAGDLRCNWGGRMTYATAISKDALTCVSPEVASASTVFVQVFTGGSLHGAVNFHYYSPFSVSELHPSSGPAEGGTLIAVRVNAFNTALVCRFGTYGVSPSRVLSTELLECVSPSKLALAGIQDSIPVDLSVELFGDRLYAGAFHYVAPLTVLQLHPKGGPVGGGTFIQVAGAGFAKRASALGYLLCKFNESTVPAIRINYEAAMCYSPESRAGIVTLEMTMNTKDFTCSGVTFAYVAMRVTDAHPLRGPLSGGIALRLVTTPFAAARELFCTYSFSDIGDIIVQASVISSSMVSCISPAYPRRAQAHLQTEDAMVGLIIDEARLSSTVVFEFTQPSELHSVHPQSGPIRGGTSITLTGNLVHPPPRHCIFWTGSGMPILVSARALTATRLECSSPSLHTLAPLEGRATNVGFVDQHDLHTLTSATDHHSGFQMLLYQYHPEVLDIRLMPTVGKLIASLIIESYANTHARIAHAMHAA